MDYEELYYDLKTAEVIKEVLDEERIPYEFDSKYGRFYFDYCTEENEYMHDLDKPLKSIPFSIDVDEWDGYIIEADSMFRIDCNDTELLKTLYEFIGRSNLGIIFGRLRLNPENGTIRCVEFVETGEIIPDKSVVKISIKRLAASLAQFTPGICDIIYNDQSAVKATARCRVLIEEISDDGDDDCYGLKSAMRIGRKFREKWGIGKASSAEESLENGEEDSEDGFSFDMEEIIEDEELVFDDLDGFDDETED